MNTNNNNGQVTAADISMMLKARYFGSGMVVGVFIAPLVKTVLAKLQPKLGGVLESLNGESEETREHAHSH